MCLGMRNRGGGGGTMFWGGLCGGGVKCGDWGRSGRLVSGWEG